MDKQEKNKQTARTIKKARVICFNQTGGGDHDDGDDMKIMTMIKMTSHNKRFGRCAQVAGCNSPVFFYIVNINIIY